MSIRMFEHSAAGEKMYRLLLHDRLTGLYNRTYFDYKLQELEEQGPLPWTIIFGDLDGLQLINDVFGSEEGDRVLQKTARILLASCRREKDIVVRWGEDEFIMLLPAAGPEIAGNICKRINTLCRSNGHGPFGLSISLGTATKKRPSQETSYILQLAESRAYQNKFKNSINIRNAHVTALLRSLGEKTYETETHARRIKIRALQLGSALGLSSSELNNLALAALLHDIGKVSIPTEILVKKRPLTAEEKEQIKQHPEIGYRIVMASYGLPKVAEAVLAHHEWWDGTGYPLGLKGEDIPLKARIIAIVDAYDALTQERPYRKPRGHQQALAEIEAAAGTQFDPKLVDIYLQLMRAVK